MTPQQWERAKEIFDAALELPPEERTAYVHASSADDLIVQRQALQLLGDYQEIKSDFLKPDWRPEPPPPEISLRPGELISGRFRIVRPLGDGGMGQVYEAHDSELGVQVALKTLRPEIAANPEVLTRFRQEVRIAHSITHPNVCRTFQFEREVGHISSDGRNPVDLTFITMEFLDGETLQQILKRDGRLSLDRTYNIATQMAEAIEAAHAKGIIHRDIKPGNVMICPAAHGNPERAVITDFGLAKISDTLSSPSPNPELSAISRPGLAIGTLAYMSPEQLEARGVTASTDIYAFGLVLYEMVTGHKVFPTTHSPSPAFLRYFADPLTPRTLVPDLPAAWETAILGCLQVDPAARFQHACHVIDVIDGANPADLRKDTSSSSHRNRRPFPPPPRRSRLRLVLAAAAILCVSLSWPAIRLYQWKANSTVAPGTLVYLAPVKNETGEKQLDNITELVQAGLSQSAHINLLDPGRVGDTLERMTKPNGTPITPAIAREIALRSGAARVIVTTITGSGGKYHLNVDIQQPDQNDPSRTREDWPKTFEWTANSPNNARLIPEELTSALRKATDWIRLKIGESDQDVLRLDASPEDVTTNSWEALSDYVEGRDLVLKRKPDDAVVAFQNASKADPGFALAFARLGDILVSLGRTQEGYRAYMQALDPEFVRRLTRRERDRIRGMFAIDTRDYVTADTAFRDYSAYYDQDYSGWAYRSLPLKMLGKTDEAISVLRKAVSLNPHLAFAQSELASYLLIDGHYTESSQWIASLRGNGFQASASEVEGELNFLQSRFDSARKAFESLVASTDTGARSNGYSLLARLFAERGEWQSAERYLDLGIADDRAEGHPAKLANKLVDRAYIRCQMLQFEPCLADIHEAQRLGSNPYVILNAGEILGIFLSKTKDVHSRQIERELQSIENAIPKDDFGVITDLIRLRTRGELALARNQIESALAAFKKADALDAPASHREYLARAYRIAAAREFSTARSRALNTEALRSYSAAAFRPGFIWHDARIYPPGFLSDQIAEYKSIAKALGSSDPKAEPCLEFLRQVRRSPLPG